MPIFLQGLALQKYRGIGPQIQKMAPFRDFNFFIGANNSGKSTVLNFLRGHLERQERPAPFGPLDRYDGGTKGEPDMAIAVPLEQFTTQALSRFQNKNVLPRVAGSVESICKMLSDGSFVWIKPDSNLRNTPKLLDEPSIATIKSTLPPQEWQQVWTLVTGTGGGSLEHWAPQTLAAFLQAQATHLELPKVHLIVAIREIGTTNDELNDFSGRGLIRHLAELQSPGHDAQEDRKTFGKINNFLQTVTGKDDAQLEIPHHREHILVHMDGKILPLPSLGTGIHEVIMIAAFCNIAKQQIVCIEEPEIHLHPVLQRKLIQHLRDSTNNQYFIATHSPSFIDTQDAAIFHVTNDGLQTYVRPSVLRRDRFAICVDLGHRASDLVQSNAIVWVEGPSDRIYLRHWIAAVDPLLIEGTHYSIIFYGGRLLSHLSADDEEVTEFIQLRSLNRHLAILIDSDRKNSRGAINQTKLRVINEFSSQSDSVAWLTKGREIENYVNHSSLQEAVKSLYSKSYCRPAAGGPYDHALHFYQAKSRLFTDVDKVKIAKLVCNEPANLKILDLAARMQEIVQMIRKANQ